MLKHYFITAMRNFWRFKLATLANVLCLALGIACLAMTYVVVSYLSHSDGSFTNAARIHVISENYDSKLAKIRFDDMPLTGPVVARFIEADFPQLEAVARRTNERQTPVSAGGSAAFASISYADPKLLDIFDFNFMVGAGSASLRRPHSAIITEKAAERILGTRNAVGKVLRVANREDVTITGVIAAIPKPTSFSFDLLASMDVQDSILAAAGVVLESSSAKIEDWWWNKSSYISYVLLPKNNVLTAAAFREQLKAFSVRHMPDTHGNFTLDLGLVGLGSVVLNLLDSQFGGFTGTSLSITVIGYLLAALVLVIACVNYANLATAMAAIRGKEVGLRKILGARRIQLIGQHLFEAMLIACAALCLVLLLIALMTPLVKRAGFDVGAQVLLQPGFAAFLIVLVAAVVLTGGFYPALVLSSTRPTQALRAGNVRIGSRLASTLLVAVQFATSSFLLIVALVMHAQNGRVLTVGRTLTEDPTVVLTSGIDAAQVDLDALRTRLLSSPHIKSVTAADSIPMNSTVSPLSISRSAEPGIGVVLASDNRVSYDYFATMGIELLAGRDFSRARGDDVTDGGPRTAGRRTHVVIDKTFAAQMGWLAPQAAVGQTVYVSTATISFPMEVIGVVESKPLNLMGIGAKSSIYELTPSRAVYAAIRISEGGIPAALEHIDTVWKELAPGVPPRRQFVDELFNQAYERLLSYNRLVAALAGFGCAIAMIGFFGMAIYVTSRRMHEIGVRKTLGASTRQILVLLLRDFSKPIVLANLIAWPVAFLASQIYLNLFVDRVRLTALPFISSLAIILLITWAVIGSRVWRAARVKPAEVLRYE